MKKIKMSVSALVCAAMLLASLFQSDIYAGGDPADEAEYAVLTDAGESVPVSAELSVSAESAILIEASSGAVIYEKDAHTRRPMASTTKIMTALVALCNSDIGRMVTVSADAVGIEGSSIYLAAKEKLSMENLLYAVMLESANDAAAAVAIDVAGSLSAFAELMNAKAAELGLCDTHFTNPHGLDDAEHYTTAAELAVIAAAAMKNDTFRTIVSTYKRVIPLGGDDGARLLLNHNKMLKLYDGATGIKTGFTKKSGRCLVSAAERDGVELIAVTLSAPDDWNDHSIMFDYGFGEYERILLTREGDQAFIMPVVGGEIKFINCKNIAEATAIVNKSGQSITHITEMKRFYYAPITEGDILGRVMYYNNGVLIGEVPITADYSIDRLEYRNPFLTWLSNLFNFKD
ncbi:MAG: D-alanyl-D-alanine carboxypeptidase family protein [Eubacteriales bacterium]